LRMTKHQQPREEARRRQRKASFSCANEKFNKEMVRPRFYLHPKF
jgi:hypothetical protein